MNVHTCGTLAATRPLSLEDARVAVFAWLLARHAGGTFSLHLAGSIDTSEVYGDSSRSGLELTADKVSYPGGPTRDLGGLDGQLEALRWLGLDWDDLWAGASPDNYSACIERLLDEGKAYRRDGPQGGAMSVRLYLAQDRQISFEDLWLGSQEIAIPDRDDPLLLDTGKPTLLLARVVGTHAHGVTHIVRSPDCLFESALDLLLYRALGWDPLTYAHLPPLEYATAQQPLSIYRERVLGLALANHLARLGWTPRGKRSLLSLPALAQAFEADRARRDSVSPDPRQLVWLNRQQLRQLASDELAAILVPYWRAAYGVAHRAEGTGLSPQAWQQVLAEAIRPEIAFLEDAAERARFAFVDELVVDRDAQDILAQAYAPEVLSAFVNGIEQVEPYTFEAIDSLVSALRWQFKASHQVRSKDVMVVMRAALTGRVNGPCVVAACQVLGRARCIDRVVYSIIPNC